jgi:hypothetical protein
MSRLALLPVLTALLAATSSQPAHTQDLQTQPNAGAKVCVAMVANASPTSAWVERLSDRLTKNLQKNKVNAVIMDSSTTMDRKLHPTNENGEESKAKECDYVLLTQIVDPKTHFEPPSTISIGGKVPSVDASDPMGGSSGPVYRDNLQINFALFRPGHLTPTLDTYVLEQASANVSDSFLRAMDREANRISHDLKKK